jgi:hypothetical protein
MSLEGKYEKIRWKQETGNLARWPPLVMRPWNVWAAKAKHESENGNREYPNAISYLHKRELAEE